MPRRSHISPPTKAKVSGPCTLCDDPIKKGQLIWTDFRMPEWFAHAACIRQRQAADRAAKKRENVKT